MSKVLVLCYCTYGHIETMTQAMAEGARSAGSTVDVKRVPETVSLDIAKSTHFKVKQVARSRRRPPNAAARSPRCFPSSPS